jgi:predicted ATPase
MNLRKLEIVGFRSLKNVSWVPGKLNVVIGPNGSGKSNLLGALQLVQDSAQGKLSENITRQGGWSAIAWDASARQISFKLDLASPQSANTPKYWYALEIQQPVIPVLTSFTIAKEFLRYGCGEHFLEEILLRDSDRAEFAEHGDGDPAILTKAEMPERETLVSTATIPFKEHFHLWNFRALIESWRIYSNLQVRADAPVRLPAVTRYEKRLTPDGQNLIPVLHTLYTEDRRFRSSVDKAMRAAFGQDYEELVFAPAGDQRIQQRIRWRSLSTAQSMPALSDGTILFLMLLAILANPEPGQVIAIDEPETGLHPGMFSIIAELAASAAEHATVILTTHSSQFLDACSRYTPTTTVAQRMNGETKLSVLEEHELARWLSEYSLGALFRSGELEGLA